MNSKRPPGRAPFMGTEDIVRRLREAQPEKLGPLGRKVRAASFVLAILVGTGGLAFGLRHNVASRVFGRSAETLVAAMAPEPLARVVSSMAEPAEVKHEASLEKPAASAPAAHRLKAPAASTHEATTAVQIKVRNAPGACRIFVDGTLMVKGSHWAGSLPRGRHQLSVRGEQGEQSFALVLHSNPQEITFDLTARHAVSRALAGRPGPGRE